RALPAEFGQNPGQIVGCEAVYGSDRDLAVTQALKIAHHHHDALMLPEGLADVPEQQLARRRRPQAARQPLEDRRAQLLFQGQNLTVDRRRGHIEPGGSPADRAVACDFTQVSQHFSVQHLARPRSSLTGAWNASAYSKLDAFHMTMARVDNR